MLNTFKGGRGKKAPYATEMRRVPSPLKALVEKLAADYKELVQEYYDPSDERLLTRVSQGLTATFLEQIENLSQENDDLQSKNLELEKEATEMKETIQNLTQTYKHWHEKATVAEAESAHLLEELAAMSLKLEEQQKKKEMAETERQSNFQPIRSTIADPKIIILLDEALKLKSNVGGAIKRKIKEALVLLVSQE